MLKKVLGTILACSFLFSCFPAPPASAADGPFSDWTEIKGLGNLNNSDLYWETEDTAEGLTINKGYFTNMTYGSNIAHLPVVRRRNAGRLSGQRFYRESSACRDS